MIHDSASTPPKHIEALTWWRSGSMAVQVAESVLAPVMNESSMDWAEKEMMYITQLNDDFNEIN